MVCVCPERRAARCPISSFCIHRLETARRTGYLDIRSAGVDPDATVRFQNPVGMDVSVLRQTEKKAPHEYMHILIVIYAIKFAIHLF